MYSFESSGFRKPLHAMVISSLIAGVALISVGNLEGLPFPFLFQTAGMICATAAVYLMAAYSLKAYRYAIEPNTIVDAEGMEQYDLIITEIMGKKMKVVARVGLRTIDHNAVTIIRRDDPTAKEACGLLCKDKRVFKYENTPISPVSCYIPVPEENCVIVIPVDETMVEILKRK